MENFNNETMRVHKLRLTDKSTWEAIKANHINDTRIHAIAIPFETGKIPNPIQYDEEGNPLEQTFKEGYHVDVMVTEVIQEWKDYTITGEHSWAHQFGMGEVVKAEDFEV
jgi:hypothetical protein